MSAEAVGWVYRHSPMKGAGLLVHLAVADTANDQHEYRFWMRQKKLAVKARTARSATQKALDDLVAAGLLVKLGERPNGLIEYQLLMPEALTVYDPAAIGGVPADRAPCHEAEGALSAGRGVPADRAPVDQGDEPKSEPNTLVGMALADAAAQSFEAFWLAYPRRVGKGAAVKAWAKAMKVAMEATPGCKNSEAVAVIIAGVDRYAAEVKGKDQQYIAHPATWLNQQRWLDEVGANTTGRKPFEDNIDRNRERPSEAINLWEKR